MQYIAHTTLCTHARPLCHVFEVHVLCACTMMTYVSIFSALRLRRDSDNTRKMGQSGGPRYNGSRLYCTILNNTMFTLFCLPDSSFDGNNDTTDEVQGPSQPPAPASQKAKKKSPYGTIFFHVFIRNFRFLFQFSH